MIGPILVKVMQLQNIDWLFYLLQKIFRSWCIEILDSAVEIVPSLIIAPRDEKISKVASSTNGWA